MKKIYSLLIMLPFFISCKTTDKEYVGLTLAKSKVNSFPQFLAAGSAKYTMEMKDEQIKGTSEAIRILGFKIKGSAPFLVSAKALAISLW